MSRPNLLAFLKDEFYSLLEQRKTDTEISKELGVGESTVWGWRRSLKIRSGYQTGMREKAVRAVEMRKNGHTIQAICDELSVTEPTVRKWLKTQRQEQ